MWTRVKAWVGSVRRRSRFEEELADELEFHLDARTEHWMSRGLNATEARRRARIEFGSVEKAKAEVRDVRLGTWFEHIAHDLRYGVRMLTKHPGFTAVALVSLAIGIGANTTIFSLVNALVLREVPMERPEELVDIYLHVPTFDYAGMSYPDFEQVRDATTDVFTVVAATTYTPVQIERGDGVEAVVAEAVTGDYFALLGIEAILGATIGPEDDRAPGAHPVVMLSHGYWRSRFGGDEAVLGSELRIGGRAYTIIGVGPEAFPGSNRAVEPAVYAPAMMLDDLMGLDVLRRRGVQLTLGKARLAPGVAIAEAKTAVDAVTTTLEATRPEGWQLGSAFALLPTASVLLYPLADPFVRSASWLLMAAAALVLLLACTNLASFLLARGRDRRREVAVRRAMGANRSTIVRQLLAETLLLGLLAGVAGTGIAVWLARALQRVELPVPFPVTLDLSLDWNVLAYTLGISTLAGALVGLIPAHQSTVDGVASTLNEETPGGGRRGQTRWQNALVITQLTVSLVLLVGAGLFLRSWQHARAVDPGFGREPAAILSVLVPNTRFARDEGRQYVRRLRDRFRELPGVEAVGIIDNLPLSFVSVQWIEFDVDGHDPPSDRETFQADHAVVDAEFFDAAGIPIVQGRSFTDTDGPDGARVAIVSEAMARRFWPDDGALGRVLRRPDADDLRVVGVARDVKVRSLGESPRSMIYLPYSQVDTPRISFVARTASQPEQATLALVAAGREVDAELWVYEVKTMAKHLSIKLLPAKLSAMLLSAFGCLALALAVIGLYGVVSYVVATRTREVGIRMAFGADGPAIVRLLTTGGARLVWIGSALGLALSLVVVRPLSGLLFGIHPVDPVTFVAAPLVLGATALLAAYLPARRASRVDPTVALGGD